jgi:hypothetical protein
LRSSASVKYASFVTWSCPTTSLASLEPRSSPSLSQIRTRATVGSVKMSPSTAMAKSFLSKVIVPARVSAIAWSAIVVFA